MRYTIYDTTKKRKWGKNSVKEGENPHIENHKTWRREIRENLNKWREHQFMGQKTQYRYDVNFLQMNL